MNSFANPTRQNEFQIEVEIPEESSCEISGCSIELHGGIGNFNPALSKLLEDSEQTKQMVSSFVRQL